MNILLHNLDTKSYVLMAYPCDQELGSINQIGIGWIRLANFGRGRWGCGRRLGGRWRGRAPTENGVVVYVPLKTKIFYKKLQEKMS